MKSQLLLTALLLMASASILPSPKLGEPPKEPLPLDIQETKYLLVGFFKSLEKEDLEFTIYNRKNTSEELHFRFLHSRYAHYEDSDVAVTRKNPYTTCLYLITKSWDRTPQVTTDCECKFHLTWDPVARQLIEEAYAQAKKELNEKNTKSEQ